MTGTLIKTINQNRQVKSAINPKARERSENLISSATISVRDRPEVVESLDISDMAVWDSPLTTWDGVDTNDEWDSFDLTQKVLARVVNKNNLFIETFDYDFFQGANNTATWDAVNSQVTFTAGQVLEIASAFKDSSSTQVVSKATLNVTVESGDFDYELSADGGSNWESVTLNSEHTFANQGSDLRIRITESTVGFPTPFGTWGSASGGTGTITFISCNYII